MKSSRTPKIEARTVLAHFNLDGQSAIQVEVKKDGGLIYDDERTFPSCDHAECYMAHLTALIMAMPQGIVNQVIDGGIRGFKIVAPPGTILRDKDITGHPISFTPKRHLLPQEIETCCVVDQFCEAPGNLDPPERAKYQCESCGQPVCGKCSSRRQYEGKIDRVCNDCQIELDGNDHKVMARLRRLAGV